MDRSKKLQNLAVTVRDRLFAINPCEQFARIVHKPESSTTNTPSWQGDFPPEKIERLERLRQKLQEESSSQAARQIIDEVFFSIGAIHDTITDVPEFIRKAVDLYVPQAIASAEEYQRKIREHRQKGMSWEEAMDCAIDYGDAPEDVRNRLVDLIEHSVLDIERDSAAKTFLRQNVRVTILTLLGKKEMHDAPPSIVTSEEKERHAFDMAEKYEKIGVLDLEHDADIFELLTRQ